jgi:Holliday junction resolvase RusA-like endonuclease
VAPRVHVYNPDDGRAWRRAVSIQLQARRQVRRPWLGPVELVLRFTLPRGPRDERRGWPRGDAENYAKPVMDAASKIVYHDDDQVVRLISEKTYGPVTGVEVLAWGWPDHGRTA